MNDPEQKYDYGWLIDLAIAGGLLLVCVWGAGLLSEIVWEVMR